jgi:HD-GYP domain-containing protein (c-di-GMP phosphodiesterase class II)
MSYKKVFVRDLEIGMFVNELDRSWLDTPFPFQGFNIESDEDIVKLSKYCEFVFVDGDKSIDEDFAATRTSGSRVPSKAQAKPVYEGPKRTYKKSVTLKEEIQKAETAHTQLTGTYQCIYQDVLNNKKLDMAQIKEAMSPMVDTVVRNPDAFILLTNLKKSDSYAYNHSMSCSVLAVALGRHIGLPRLMLRDLALGAMLFDVGRAQLPQGLLSAERKLDTQEMKTIHKHVEIGMVAVAKTPNASKDVLDMVATHHERFDGSGYPRGLKGEEIPLFGRIAGIVDCYDAITSHRPYADTLSSYEAAKVLYEWRDKEFQGALVEQFIQVVGIYTMGTIVELTDGRIGVVSTLHREARMRPVVTILLNRDKEFMDDFEEVDLRREKTGLDGNELKIKHSLPNGSYDIDPAEYFL